MSCNRCNCSPCACPPSVLSNPQIIGGVLDGPVINGPTINNGQANNLSLASATLDCNSRGCTQPHGICNDSLATTSFVCQEIAAAISSSNSAFCQAVDECLSGGAGLCTQVASCINSTPGIINNASAFGPLSFASQTVIGVTRYATRSEIDQAICNVAIEPCTLADLFCTPNTVSPFWTCFQNAVNTAVFGFGGSLCAAVAACGFAPLNSPAFIGVPTGPTAALGTNTTQLATTAFVQGEIASQVPGLISSAIAAAITSNPTFCAAVAGCGGGGGGGAVFLQGFVSLSNATFPVGEPCLSSGGTVYAGSAAITCVGTTPDPCGLPNPYGVVRFTFGTPQANANYLVLWPDAPSGGPGLPTQHPVVLTKTTTYIEFGPGTWYDPFATCFVVNSGSFALVASA